MNCREFEEFLAGGAARERRLTDEARAHLESCPDCGPLSEMMAGEPVSALAAGAGLDQAIVDRVTERIVRSIKPVRPLASRPVFTAGLVMAWAIITWAGAARSGFDGYFALSGMERVVIYLTLTVLAGTAAWLFTSEMIPGSGEPIGPGWLLGAVCLGMVLEMAAFFHNYDMTGFVAEGIACLGNGLLHAVPIGLAAWILLRRGFAVQPVGAGLTAGVLAGLGGLGLLELHCPNLKAPHQAFWHMAVVPVSGAAGGVIGWLSRVLRDREFRTRTGPQLPAE